MTATHARAAALASHYDPIVRRIAAAAGGSVHGDRGGQIAHSVKGLRRLAEKVTRPTARQPVEAALREIVDLNRYTVVFDRADYTRGVVDFAHCAADYGLEFVAGRNTWHRHDYKGYNARFRDRQRAHPAIDPSTPGGPRHTFEVQFHTPASVDAKSDNHRYYRLVRDSKIAAVTAAAAMKLQADRNAAVPTPPGAEKLDTRVEADAPPAEVSPEALDEAERLSNRLAAERAG